MLALVLLWSALLASEEGRVREEMILVAPRTVESFGVGVGETPVRELKENAD
jgi:hypothetical protein